MFHRNHVIGATAAAAIAVFGPCDLAHSTGAGTIESTEATVLRYIAPARTEPIRLALLRKDGDVVLLDGRVVVAVRRYDEVRSIEIGGPDATDTELLIDYAAGPIAHPIDYRAGVPAPATVNALVLSGGGVATASHVAYGPHDGVIERDGAVIRYAKLYDKAFYIQTK